MKKLFALQIVNLIPYLGMFHDEDECISDYKRRFVVFDDCVFGHHLEYLHHLYIRALALPHSEFIFAVPEDFKKVSDKMEWTSAKNVKFVFFKQEQSGTSRSRSKLVGSFVEKYAATDVFLISLMSFLPWLPFYIPAKTRVSGIVYLIYLYRWCKSGLKTRVLDVLKYLIFSRCRLFHRVFLLNDKAAPRYLNQKFKTKKFCYLPDPVAIETTIRSQLHDIRGELGVGKSDVVFLHFGGLSGIDRKGTVNILSALSKKKMPPDYVFIFAGRVGESVSERFYAGVKKGLDAGNRIIVFDKFCEYEFLCNLCVSSDAILIPYLNNEQSSGVVAYAALTGTPVVAPRGGLLGKIVRRNKLGFMLDDISSTGIVDFLSSGKVEKEHFHVPDSYLSEASLEKFLTVVIEKD